ncbi:NAD(+) diphosphatase [Microvirga pudoricolor]|uniref:NAD(+) diphosphatase n=1 Tax=Microvirga pudoricolor TaxID=2778729 RepID=UPI00194FE691|nr:NAD(+) diphosphatase [Microvirga pudoricolor]MBM6596200.1 NAD(+) diphosphatase [Microvirga pudoricolor]
MPIAYITNPTVRHSAERDPEALARHAGDPRTALVLLAGDVPVLRAGQPGTGLLPVTALDRAGGPREQVLLGTIDDRPVIAALAAPEAAALFENDPDFITADLRSVATKGLVPEEELGLLATAKSLLGWHARHRFCANCGNPTQASQAGYRRDCPACGTQHFPRTDPVVIMLIARGDQCLLGRGAHFAERTYSCLAGFLEPGETVEDAVRRETFEEAGIRVGPVRYLASQPWPFPSSIMIGCLGEAESEAITMDAAEMEDVRWFSKEDVRRMLAGEHEQFLAPNPIAIANHLLRLWVEG